MRHPPHWGPVGLLASFRGKWAREGWNTPLSSGKLNTQDAEQLKPADLIPSREESRKKRHGRYLVALALGVHGGL